MQHEWSIYGTLEEVSRIYHDRYRLLRVTYKWGPDVADNIELSRFIKIYDECVEENEKKKQKKAIDFEEFD